MFKAQSIANSSPASIDLSSQNISQVSTLPLASLVSYALRHGFFAVTLLTTLLCSSNAFGQATQIEAEAFSTSSGVVTEGTGDTGGGQNLGNINGGDWAEYSINIPQAGSYEVDFRVASNGEGGSIAIVSGGSTLGSVDVAVNGEWQVYTNVSTIVTFANAGPQTIRLNFNGDSGYLYNLNWFSYQVPPLFIEAEGYTAQNGVQTEATTDTGGGLNLSYISNNDWSQYSVTIPAAGDYVIDFRTASDTAGGSIDIVADGVTIGNITVPGTSGWQNWTTVTANVNFATAGTKTLRLNYIGGDGSLFNLNWLTIYPYIPVPPLTLTVGNAPQQQMRYGIDYERLWYWTGAASLRDRIAEWSVADCDVDYVRVAMNSKYELNEGVFDLNAYTGDGGNPSNDRIIPMMQDMKDANPDVKFFASPRPLNESHNAISESKNDIRWQPYPLWVTGAPSYTSGSFDFKWDKCAEYFVKYLLLMKHNGFKISYLDVSNEWQSNVGGGRVTQDDMDNIHEYLHVTYFNAPWEHPEYPGLTLAPSDIPEIVAPSSWNYTQGAQWVNNLDTGDKEAISIVSSHNTDRTGTAQDIVDATNNKFDQPGDTVPEVWNTEVHGWKSTSNADEVLTYAYMLECINAGFSGLNGWLARGTPNEGHSYIVNSERSVKYYMFEKLTNTSNRGYALEVNEPDEFKVHWDSDPDQEDADSAVSALIRGNLMTVWVLNHSDKDYPIIINPTGRTISDHPIKVTRWSQHDGISIEGLTQTLQATTTASVETLAQDNSAYCIEILLEPEMGTYVRIEAESYDSSNPSSHSTETTTDVGGGLNVNNINNGDWTSYDGIDLSDATNIRFRIAAPSGRPDGEIEIRTGSQTGPIIGRTAIPTTGDWQEWLTIETPLEATSGTHDLYLTYTEAGSNQSGSGAMFNLNWLEIVLPAPPATEAPSNVTATANGTTQIDLAWNAVTSATSYKVLRATSAGGAYSEIASGLTTTSTSDTNATPGVTYYYVVRAVNTGGESANSSFASATIPLNLDPPAGFSATAVGASHINLSWTASQGATSYKIFRSTSSRGTYTEILSGITTTSVDDFDTSIGTNYYYYMRAVAFGTESANSSFSFASLSLDAPTNLVSTHASSSQIDISWNSVPGATGYSVKRSLTNGGTYTTIATGVTSLSYSDTASLTAGLRYYYVVTATLSGSESNPSNEDSAVPSDPILTENVVMASLDLGYNLQGGEEVSASIAQSGLGQFYQIMASPDLTNASGWSPASAVHLGNGGLLEIDFDFNYSALERHFFRLEAWTEE
ncbi:MAG: carbohydrate-binding protein [Roseibacillus sp.]